VQFSHGWSFDRDRLSHGTWAGAVLLLFSSSEEEEENQKKSS
jgi:hypothetical protein